MNGIKWASIIVGSSILITAAIVGMIHGLTAWLGDPGGWISLGVITLGIFAFIAIVTNND